MSDVTFEGVESEIAGAEPRALVTGEVRSLPPCQNLYAAGDYQVAVALRSQAPHLMNEIGRLREITFRAASEGTGKSRDIDAFDDYYQQLFVWHRASEQVLGAYRLCMTDVVWRERGIGGLYTRTLFQYDEGFLSALGPALEVGRSFVRPECQGMGRVLALLWRGIAHLLAARPRYRTLFGPVSVSSAYSDAARRLIASRLCVGRYRHPLFGKVEALRPVAVEHAVAGEADEAARVLSNRVAELEPDRKGLPVLIREYVKLGGQFLAFSVDPAFHDAMDGLVSVNLDRTNPKLLALYMGADNYEHFRRSRRGSHPQPMVPSAP